MNENPIIDFPILPTTKPYPLLPLTHGPPPIYWLGTSGWCLSLVCAPLLCESMAYLLFIRLPWLRALFGLCCSFLISCGVDESLGLHSLHLISFFGMGLNLVWALLPSVRPLSFFTSSLWVDQCSCHAILLLLPLDLCLLSLIWVCHVLFSYSIHVPQCFYRFNPHIILGFLGPFHSFRHPQPALFLWASLAYFVLTFLWAFATTFWASPAQLPYPLLSGFIGLYTNPIC